MSSLGETRGAFWGGRRAGLGCGSRGKRDRGHRGGSCQQEERRARSAARGRGAQRDRSCALGVSLPRSDVSNSGGFGGKLPDPSSCRVKRCPSWGEGGGLAPHPTPWGLPPQSPCRASGDAVSLAYSQWSCWCQVLGFIPGNDGRGSRSPSLVPCAAPAPQGKRLLPSPRCRQRSSLSAPRIPYQPSPGHPPTSRGHHKPSLGGSFPGAETNGTPLVAPRLSHPSSQDSEGVTGTLDPQFLEREETGNGFMCGGWKGILAPCLN